MTVKFVAEVSSNHYRDLQRCLAFVDRAADIGCAAVKFQLFRIDELFAPEVLDRSAEHRRRKEWELPVSFLAPLAARCQEKGIAFACTPFFLEAVEQLLPYVDFYKIASYELLWGDLLGACARTQRPVVLSTGMATLDEAKLAVATLKSAGCTDLTVLHCVSSYPAKPSECNLAAIETLRGALKCEVGWSDHSVTPAVIYRAVFGHGASLVEFHLYLEGRGVEYAAGHCWLPDEIRAVIEGIRLGLSAQGDGHKRPADREVEERQWRADPADGLRPLQAVRKQWQP